MLHMELYTYNVLLPRNYCIQFVFQFNIALECLECTDIDMILRKYRPFSLTSIPLVIQTFVHMPVSVLYVHDIIIRYDRVSIGTVNNNGRLD